MLLTINEYPLTPSWNKIVNINKFTTLAVSTHAKRNTHSKLYLNMYMLTICCYYESPPNVWAYGRYDWVILIFLVKKEVSKSVNGSSLSILSKQRHTSFNSRCLCSWALYFCYKNLYISHIIQYVNTNTYLMWLR